MILFAAVAGALVVGGLVLMIAELIRRAPAPGTPVRRPLAGFVRGGGSHGRTIVLAVIVALAALAVTRWPGAAIAAGLGVVFVPKLISTGQAKRRTAMLEGLEQWIRRLADMLSASRGLEDALEVSARTAPAAVAPQVTALARRLSARVSTEDALRAFAEEIDDPAGDRIVAALLIVTGQRGGGVQGVLSALAELLARDVSARREIEADRAEHRTTLRWIIGFICGFTVFAVVNRSYSAPYGTWAGEAVLAIVVALYAAGLYWLQKLGQIPVPGRFLDRSQVAIDDLEPRQFGSRQFASPLSAQPQFRPGGSQ
jgi:Flp pilus assembly protein TadB